MLTLKKANVARIAQEMGTVDERLDKALGQLAEEEFLARRGDLYYFR